MSVIYSNLVITLVCIILNGAMAIVVENGNGGLHSIPGRSAYTRRKAIYLNILFSAMSK